MMGAEVCLECVDTVVMDSQDCVPSSWGSRVLCGAGDAHKTGHPAALRGAAGAQRGRARGGQCQGAALHTSSLTPSPSHSLPRTFYLALPSHQTLLLCMELQAAQGRSGAACAPPSHFSHTAHCTWHPRRVCKPEVYGQRVQDRGCKAERWGAH